MFSTPSRTSRASRGQPDRETPGRPHPSSSRVSRASTPFGAVATNRSPTPSHQPSNLNSPSTPFSTNIHGRSNRTQRPISHKSSALIRNIPVFPSAPSSQGTAQEDAESVAAEMVETQSQSTVSKLRFPPDASTQLQEGTALVRDEWMAVSAYSKLPTEVLEELDSVDFYIDAFKGALDVHTGYAYVVSRTKCFVWSYNSRGMSSPTCFTFPVAQSNVPLANDLAHCGLFSRTSSRDPGLILVNAAGEIHFWPGITSSLTSQDRAQTLSVSLNSQETVTEMAKVDDSTFVISTSHSRMLRLNISSQGGTLHASVAPFSQPRGILGRLFGSASTMGFANEAVVSIAVGPHRVDSEGRDIYAIGNKTVQKWQLSESGGEKLIAEHDVRQVIASSVLQVSDQRFSASQSLAFRLIDGAVQNDGRLTLLYSQSKPSSQPLSYGIATLELLKDESSFVVRNLTLLKHTSHNDPRPYAEPSLSLPNGGPAAFVTFADTVILKLLQQGCQDFEEVVKLKHTARNRFVGTGCDAVDAGASSVACLSLISTSSGSLLIEMNLDQVSQITLSQASSSDRQKAKTDRLKSKIEQALYYSDSPQNPLSFQLPTHIEGVLMTASEELSSQILQSHNPIAALVPFSVDLRVSLKDRLLKLRSMMQYIVDSGHLEQLPQTCRRRLLADAELAAAAQDLWLYQNDYISTANIRGKKPTSSPLSESIERVMVEIGQSTSEDPIRSFFRYHMTHIHLVFDQLLSKARATIQQPLRERSSELLEINRISLSVFQAATRYRRENGNIYGLLSSSPTAYEPWTAKSDCIELLESLFNLTNNLIPARTRELGNTVDVAPSEFLSSHSFATTATANATDDFLTDQRLQSELKSQLCSLAELTLGCYEERLGYLEVVATDSGLERELSVFTSSFHRSRPLLIHPLVSIGRAPRAFTLAETHRDFSTLVELCNDPSLGTSQARIDHYLSTYQQPFAFALYDFFLAQQQPRRLLTQKNEDATTAGLVLSYLQSTGNDRLAWLHHLTLKQFQPASEVLDRVAKNETQIDQRKTALSLAKLSYVASLTMDQLTTVTEQRRIEKFDDQLDLVSVHTRLQALFINLLESEDFPSSFSPTELVESIVDSCTLRLAEYPTFRSIYLDLVHQLVFQRNCLTSEDLIDLLTLKDTPDPHLHDFATAIEVYLRSLDQLPQQRAELMLQSIWRRCLLRDDWFGLSDTHLQSDDDLLSQLEQTALYHTLVSIFQHPSSHSTFRSLEQLISWQPQSQQQDEEDEEEEEKKKIKIEKQWLPFFIARFSSSSPNFLNGMFQDVYREFQSVHQIYQDSDLPRLFDEIVRLAQNNVIQRSSDDDQSSNISDMDSS